MVPPKFWDVSHSAWGFRWFLSCLLSLSVTVCFAGSKASFDWLQGIYRMWLKVYFSGLASRNTETLGNNNSLELFDTRPCPGCNCTVYQLLQVWWHLLTFGLPIVGKCSVHIMEHMLSMNWQSVAYSNFELWRKRGSRIVEINQTSDDVFQINQQ